MKRIILVITVLISINTYSQDVYKIIVDGKEMVVEGEDITQQVAQPNATDFDTSVNSHKIKPGENLYSISRLYNLTIDELCKLNNISRNAQLQVGEQLKVTTFVKMNATMSNASYHIVKKGNTLYSLAKKYGLSVTKLKALNNLNSNEILIGQHLRIN